LILAGLILAAGLAALSQAGTVLIVERPVVQPNVIVMLASHEWERIPAVAALARESPSSMVLLTVPKTITEYNCQKCPFRADWLESQGVDPTHIQILPDRAANTRDEALAVLAYSRQIPVERLAVVTSPYHTRRSLGIFEQVFAGTGVQIGIYPASASSPAVPNRWWWNHYDRGYVFYEWAALAYYRMKYGVPMRQSTRHEPSLISPTASVPE
jgi:uncharacterized SAM-binding protein YcdF (DUF218 family)